MTDLSEKSLEEALRKLAEYRSGQSKALNILPTKLIVYPAYHRIAFWLLYPSLRNRRAHLNKRRGILRRVK